MEKAQELADLYEEIQRDKNYRNENMGSIFVPGKGAIRKGVIVFVGEAPGREEEKEQSPFIGAAGKNLNALLEAVTFPRDEVFITNLVKYRPFTQQGNNRNPSIPEGRSALPYLLKELEILKPKLVVCLGLSPAKAILGNPHLKMGECNAAIFKRHGLRIFVTYHPSPFNYQRPEKREAMLKAFQEIAALDRMPPTS